jgi:hypothetical protein
MADAIAVHAQYDRYRSVNYRYGIRYTTRWWVRLSYTVSWCSYSWIVEELCILIRFE